jgi:hypothetical protein
VHAAVDDRFVTGVGHEVIGIPEAVPLRRVRVLGEACEFLPLAFGRGPQGERKARGHIRTVVARSLVS